MRNTELEPVVEQLKGVLRQIMQIGGEWEESIGPVPGDRPTQLDWDIVDLNEIADYIQRTINSLERL